MNATRILPIIWAFAALFCTPSCSNSETDGRTSSAVLRPAECDWDVEQVILETAGDSRTTFSAEMDDSSIGWCSFTSGGVMKGIYGRKAGESATLYLHKNTTRDDREAQIRVYFSDGTTVSLTLTQSCEEPKQIEPGDSAAPLWAELPRFKENDSYIHKTYFTTLSDKSRVRNYSVCFDIDHKVSRWVAYPLHDIYMVRGSYEAEQTNGRTNAWAFDDAVTEYNGKTYRTLSTYLSDIDAYDTYTLPIIKHSWQQNVPKGAYNDREENKPLNLNRGHMLPSASRYNTWTTNAQTFYATNMMPQEGKFNSGAWGKAEDYTRKSCCSDTLYVVVGTLFEEDGSVRITARDRDITVPSHCYKLLLRTRSGKTGKKISDITSADELVCIGFLFENGDPKGVTMASSAVPVAEIERRSGFSFFSSIDPSIADRVKSQCNLADWSAFK